MKIDVDRLQRDLEAIVGPRRVSMRGIDLDTYARDMWPRLLIAYREGEPITFGQFARYGVPAGNGPAASES